MNNSKKVEESESASAQSYSFYEEMPRFVHEMPNAGENRMVLPVQRAGKWKGKHFQLTILPVCVIDRAAKGEAQVHRYLFPGADEEFLEQALRRLSSADNINFDTKMSMLCFTLTQIIGEYGSITGDSGLTRDRLEKSLDLLRDVKYILKRKTKQLHLRPIEEVRWIENNGEIYYRIIFSPLFFERGDIFDLIFKE